MHENQFFYKPVDEYEGHQCDLIKGSGECINEKCLHKFQFRNMIRDGFLEDTEKPVTNTYFKAELGKYSGVFIGQYDEFC